MPIDTTYMHYPLHAAAGSSSEEGLSMPSYPQQVAQHRHVRKQRRRRRKHKQPKESHAKPLPMPLQPKQHDDTPQVLLWQSSKRRGSSGSLSSCSSSSDIGNAAARSRDDEEEERCLSTSTNEIFRQQAYDRQAPSSATSSELLVEQLVGDAIVEREEEEQEKVVDLLGPIGPQWYQLEYWKERFTRNCCLPRRRRSSSAQHHMRRLSTQSHYLDYRPTYLGYTADQNPWLQQPQPYYVMPWPQQQQQIVSPMADSPMQLYPHHPYHHHHHHHSWQQQSARQSNNFVSPEPSSTNPNNKELSQDEQLMEELFSHNAPNSNPTSTPNPDNTNRKSHVRTASSLPEAAFMTTPEDQFGGFMRTVGGANADNQSVSSLESDLQSDYYYWKNNNNVALQQQYGKVVLPENNNEGNPAFSNRISKLRGRSPSPRPSSKPPVAPPRRGAKQHRAQHTNSTMASTALPPLPSPQPFSPPPLLQQPPSRDLTRSFSEASANTNGSRHRRGGTVCEFSFESLITNSPRTKRSNSLPLEVQIQVHYAPTPTGNNNAPSRWRLDSNGDDSLVFLDKPKKSRPAPEEEETGYISPLEEEQFLNGSVIHAVPKSASDMDASPQTSTSNPQDSLCGDDDEDYNDNEMDDSIVGTPTKKKPHGEESAASSPFSKLKDDAPLMSAGEAWMLQWCNRDTTAVADVPFSAVTPTQSPSNSSTNTSRSSRSVVRRRVAKPPKSPLSQEPPAPGDKARLEYLPKNLALEQKWRTNHAETSAQGVAAVSGWVAFGFGDSLLEKLQDDGAHLDRGDIAYIIAPSASNKLWVSSKVDGTFENLVDWQDCRVEVHEISRLRGRAVVVKRQDQAVCTLLPVCLAEHYDGSPQLFDPTQCFPHGDYLPDEQQYTTMHIMFALDSLLKANQTWMY